jgi:hypothetical protein
MNEVSKLLSAFIKKGKIDQTPYLKDNLQNYKSLTSFCMNNLDYKEEE